MALIVLCVSKNQLIHVKRAATSAEAWNLLKDAHELKGPVRKAALYKQLYRMKKESNQSMTQYINDFLSKTEQLGEVGIRIPDELMSIMLLNSLPTEYEGFCIAIESRDDIPSVDSLKLKLIEQEARRDEQTIKESAGENDALFVRSKANQNKNCHENARGRNTKFKATRFSGKCFKCGKQGHRSNECKSKTDNFAGSSIADVMPAMVLHAEPEKSNDWYLDSGATKHMCNDRSKFSSVNNETRAKVYTAAEHCVTSAGAGEVKINLKLRDKGTNTVKLQDTVLVPSFRNNLMSVSRITDKNYSVLFKKGFAIVKRADGSVALTAKRQGNLYIVDKNKSKILLRKHCNPCCWANQLVNEETKICGSINHGSGIRCAEYNDP